MVEIARKWQELITHCFFGDKIMYPTTVPTKPRRKDLEVPVHRNHLENENSARKTTRNVNRKHRCRSRERKSPNVQEDADENENYLKVSKKQLWRDNLQLTKEKEDVIAKFNELEDLSVKKITKLREKVSTTQNEKFEIEEENRLLRENLERLTREYEETRNQLEQCKFCQNCEEFKNALEQFTNENVSLKKSKFELSEDLDMLKTVVFRLNVQLERYQEKMRKYNIKDTIDKNMNNVLTTDNSVDIPRDKEALHSLHPHVPISWGKVNTHTLGPLLEAFQETINEKDEIINEYEAEFSEFSGKLKEVVSENEKLHFRLNEDEQCSGKLKEELEVLRKELQSCKDQNDALIKKCALKQDKVEEILRVYESKVDQMKRDYNVLHDQYFKCRNELTTLNERNKALLQSQDDFKSEKKNYIPISVHTASVNECKKWYEELKIQYEKEKEKLKTELVQYSKEMNDLKENILIFQKEKQEKEEKIKQLEKHIRKGEAKYLELEHALNECQVSKTACKKQLHKAMSFAKDLVSEQEALLKALNDRQQENRMVTKFGADMASKMDTLKTQLKEVQRDAWQELNTVEGRIQEQEQTIEQMKEEYEKEIIRLELIIKNQTDQSNLLKTQNNLPISPYVLYKDKIQE